MIDIECQRKCPLLNKSNLKWFCILNRGYFKNILYNFKIKERKRTCHGFS